MVEAPVFFSSWCGPCIEHTITAPDIGGRCLGEVVTVGLYSVPLFGEDSKTLTTSDTWSRCDGCCHSMTINWRWKMTQRRAFWIVGTVSVLLLSLLGSTSMANFSPTIYCDYFKGEACKTSPPQASHLSPPSLPPRVVNLPPARDCTDEEMASLVLAKDVLSRPPHPVEKAKLAFMFLTAGPLPFELLWEKFFEGHEGRYSVYVHASEKEMSTTIWKSSVFLGRDVRPQKVYWGRIEMVDAERRLLANALHDLDNQYFVLLSETCIPLHSFDYVYDYLMGGNLSFVDCFDDPGPHGQGRYLEQMKPEVKRSTWRKGSQWFSVNREHALLVMADHLYYDKFKWFCKPGPENRNCYPDEHYISTFLHIMDPVNLANWSVTHVDWSEGKWHPKSYEIRDVTKDTFARIQAINEHVHVSSDGRGIRTVVPCLWNGQHRPCFLFARKFLPQTADVLLQLLPGVTWQRPQQSL